MAEYQKAPGRRGWNGCSSRQFELILKSIQAMVRSEVAPLKAALTLILQKLDIPQPQTPQQEQTCKSQIGPIELLLPVKTQQEEAIDRLDSLEDALQLDLSSFNTQQLEDLQDSQEFVVPQPRGNNTAFNLLSFPQEVPYYGMAMEHRKEWEQVYGRVKRLVEGKQARKERGWFDFEKKMLVEFVTKGVELGCSANHLTRMLGVSSSTLKRWRNFFK